MSHKPLYLFLSAAAAICLIWLHFWVVPDLAVVTLDPKADMREGQVFCEIIKVGKKYKFSDNMMLVAASARGWGGVFAWWPYAVASVLVGGGVGWVVGRGLQVDDFADRAEDKIKKTEDDLAEATQKLMSADARLTEAKRLESDHEKLKKMAESAKSDKIAAEIAAADAERKLLAERDRHKEELGRAGARIKELKEKSKKNKAVDEP